MKNTTTTANPIIAKMAQIMMAIETRIQQDGPAYLPKQRSLFIDRTALILSDLEDSFFTYDQIKQLVINMVNRNESGAGKWTIDEANSTTDKVAIAFIDQEQEQALIPLNVFLAASCSQIGLTQ
jgi:hypothetical protein